MTTMRRCAVTIGPAWILLLASTLVGQEPALRFGEDWLVIDPVGRAGRSAVHTDAIEAAIVRGTWRPPKDGEEITHGDGRKATWRAAKMAQGSLRGRRGGYAFTTLESDVDRPALLETRGHGIAYVNGEIRTGNPYGTGWYRVPMKLKKGRNEFLFQFIRGPIRPLLSAVAKPVFFSGKDHTVPDLIVGEATRTWLGVIVVNARADPLTDATITIRGNAIAPDNLSQLGVQNVRLPTVPAFGVYKCCVPCRGTAPHEAGATRITLELLRLGSKGVIPAGGGLQDRLELALAVRNPLDRHKRVYRSPVDGSAQYYAVNPPIGEQATAPGKALFLSLHGAGVEATGQANAYSQKSWGYLVAATNRRPFGFDWEDWGRLDAMDVLDKALAHYPIDRSKVYLTGHSMGGHGTWQVGAVFPDRFAAIGPSAGWISFQSYVGRRRSRGGRSEPSPIDAFLTRTAAPSDTLALKQNYTQHGIFILHGDADDNVPVREARNMVEALKPFHRDFRIHEEPGKGHWWDNDSEPGAACVDFQPMFDFFARRRLPRRQEVRRVDFTTVNPAISATCNWVRIDTQTRRLVPSRVNIRFDPIRRGFEGVTENVSMFHLDVTSIAAGEKVALEIDGQKLECAVGIQKAFRLERPGEEWRIRSAASPSGTPRAGPFKAAFCNDFCFVVGTHGTAAETRWAMHKARYDAETFWYRGNGSVEILTDDQYLSLRRAHRNVILYGNSTTHSAWAKLLGPSPVQVDRNGIHIGERTIEGADLACLFVRPHPSDEAALVGVVSGTGLAGMRLTDRLTYFTSGVHYPDVFVAGSDLLEKGAGGVRAAGLFGADWSLAAGEFVWR